MAKAGPCTAWERVRTGLRAQHVHALQQRLHLLCHLAWRLRTGAILRTPFCSVRLLERGLRGAVLWRDSGHDAPLQDLFQTGQAQLHLGVNVEHCSIGPACAIRIMLRHTRKQALL